MDNRKKHFTASAIVIDDNRILLVNHVKLGVWLYPGGHVEEDETPDQTVIREVKEETGLDVDIISNKDDSLSYIESDVTSLNMPYAFLCELVGDHYHNDLIYLCKITKGNAENIKCAPKESSEIKFFRQEELEGIKLFPNFRKLVNKVFDELQN